jgi:hypothetical protein
MHHHADEQRGDEELDDGGEDGAGHGAILLAK